MLEDFIYLDNNATTAVSDEVMEKILPFFQKNYGNPSSEIHAFGWSAKAAVEKARKQVAESIGSEYNEIYFTSGATESINLALKGIVERYKNIGNHIITVKTEHKAVLDVCHSLEEKKLADVTYLSVDENGQISLEELKKSVSNKTILVCVMLANNETGVIQDIKAISEICREKNILLMSDTTQAIGKIPVNVNELGIDIACISAHKIYGPKGVGAIYLRRKKPRVSILPLIEGGGQEKNIRSGTLNSTGIVGLGEACFQANQNIEIYRTHTQQLKNLFIKKLEEANIGFFQNFEKNENHLSNTLSCGFKGIKAKELLKKCPQLAFSLGSACSSNSNEISHVLAACHLSKEKIESSFRISFGKNNTEEEVLKANEILLEAVFKLKD